MFDMHGETVCYNEKDETAVIIDQTLLPGEIVTLELWEKEEMFDLAGRERDTAAPDLPEYLMSTQLPNVRKALRRATEKNLGDDFWKKVLDDIGKEDKQS